MKNALDHAKPLIDAVNAALADPREHYFSPLEDEEVCSHCGKPLEEHPMGHADA